MDDGGKKPCTVGQQNDTDLPEEIRRVISDIHSSETQAVLYLTGGASHGVAWLHSVPGASATLLETCIPYSRGSTRRILAGCKYPSSLASVSAALALAAAAYRSAVKLASKGTPVVGVGAACALATKEPKRGEHRAYVATHSENAICEYDLLLAKGRRSRLEEDLLVSRLVVQALSDACAPRTSLTHENSMKIVRDFLIAGDVLSPPRSHERRDVVTAVLEGDSELGFAQYDGNLWRLDATSVTALLPGSFNPLHHGHRKLRAAAQRVLGPEAVVGYELAVSNPDKPTLSSDVVRARASQFAEEDGPLVISQASMFKDKALILPNTVFVIGYDTAIRIIDPRYYGDSTSTMVEALLTIARKGCRFLVAGRRATPDSGEFLTLTDVRVPPGFGHLFEEIPEHMFREDVSSTKLRERKNDDKIL